MVLLHDPQVVDNRTVIVIDLEPVQMGCIVNGEMAKTVRWRALGSPNACRRVELVKLLAATRASCDDVYRGLLM